jgi:hypothetical protein
VTTPGYVRLTCDDPALDVTVLLGPDPVHVTSGVGGWQVTARPRQVGMTTWAGVEPIQLSLSLMFDGWASSRSQEAVLRRVFAVARGDDESPPGVLRVHGIPLPARRWVIEDVEYGDVVLSTGVGGVAVHERLRQALTLTLREYVPPSYLQLRKHALRGGKGKTRVVTSKHGDTPAKIAHRQHCKWTDLRTLNPKLVHKANQALKTGTKLRVPVADTTKHKARGRKGTGHATKRDA